MAAMRTLRSVVLVGVVAVLVGCGGAAGDRPSATPTPTATTATTATVAGTLAVEMDFTGNLKAGNHTQNGACLTRAGYDDIRDGASVAVLDAAGKTVAMGEVDEEGLQVPPGSTSMTDAWCGFAFTVPGVPTDGGFYSIAIASRDPYRVTEEEAFDGPELTLGDIPGQS